MKHNRHFFIIFYALTITVSCTPMERDNQLQTNNKEHWLNNIQEIMTVKNPRCVRYLENQLVVLEKDADLCWVNLKTKQIEEYSSVKLMNNLTLEVKNKKVMIGSSGESVVYEKKSPIEKYSHRRTRYVENLIQGFAWDEVNNTVFIHYITNSYQIRKYNYKTSNSQWICLGDEECQAMALHPNKEIMCMTDYSGNIFLRNLDDTLSMIKKICLVKKDKMSCWFCQFSLDGSYVVCGNEKKIFVINLINMYSTNRDKIKWVEAFSCEEFNNIAFHPNGSILGILCSSAKEASRVRGYNAKIVRYWDIKSQQFIKETSEFCSQAAYDFDFSADGLEVAIALQDKCVRAHVCFAIKDKYMCHFCMLNEIKGKMTKNFGLPEELALFILNLFLESLRKF